jgi:hypothetical protein
MLATNYVNEAKRGVVAGQFESVADARDLLKAEMSRNVKPLQRRMTPNLPPVHETETMWNAALPRRPAHLSHTTRRTDPTRRGPSPAMDDSC